MAMRMVITAIKWKLLSQSNTVAYLGFFAPGGRNNELSAPPWNARARGHRARPKLKSKILCNGENKVGNQTSNKR